MLTGSIASFREATINLLIHPDYGDHGRKASIRFLRDRTVFWNPGDAFATTDEFLDRTEKEVRNPAIVAAFRRIGLSGPDGTGVRAIFRGWQRLGRQGEDLRASPVTRATVQRRAATATGATRREAQRDSDTAFAFACRQGGASLTDAKAVTGQAGPEARKGAQHACNAKTAGAAGRCRPVRPYRTPQGSLDVAQPAQ